MMPLDFREIVNFCSKAPRPRMFWPFVETSLEEYRTLMEWFWHGKSKVLEAKSAPCATPTTEGQSSATDMESNRHGTHWKCQKTKWRLFSVKCPFEISSFVWRLASLYSFSLWLVFFLRSVKWCWQGETDVPWEKTCPSVIFATTDLTCIGLESDPGLFGEKPAIDRAELIRKIFLKTQLLLHVPTGWCSLER